MFIITLARALLQASVASAYYGALNDMLTLRIVGCTWTSMGYSVCWFAFVRNFTRGEPTAKLYQSHQPSFCHTSVAWLTILPVLRLISHIVTSIQRELVWIKSFGRRSLSHNMSTNNLSTEITCCLIHYMDIAYQVSTVLISPQCQTSYSTLLKSRHGHSTRRW